MKHAQCLLFSTSNGWICLLSAWMSMPTHAIAQEKPRLALNVGAHTMSILDLIVSHNERYVISTSADNTVCIWDLATGELFKTLRFPGQPTAVTLSEDGFAISVAVVGEKTRNPILFRIRVPDGQLLRTDPFPVEAKDNQGFLVANSGFASSKDQKRVAFWTYRLGEKEGEETACRLYLWEMDGQKKLVLSTKMPFQEYFKGFAPAFQSEFSPDGRYLATIDSAGVAQLIDLKNVDTAVRIGNRESPVWGIAWSPDSQYLVGPTRGTLATFVSQWNVKGEVKAIHAMPNIGFGNLNNKGEVRAVFSRDGKSLLVTRSYVGEDGDLPDSVTICALGSDKIDERAMLQMKDGGIRAGALTSRFAIIATWSDILVIERENASNRRRLSGKEKKMQDAAWRSDDVAVGWGAAVAKLAPPERSFDFQTLEIAPTSGKEFQRARHAIGKVSIGEGDFGVELSIKRGEERHRFLFNMPKTFTMVTENSAAAVAGPGLIELYDLTKRDPQYDMSLKTQVWALGETTALAPSSNGRYILAAQASGVLGVLAPGRELPLLQLYTNESDWIAWTPEGYYAASPGGERLMGWHVNDGDDKLASFYPAAQFRKTLYRPDVIKLLLKAGSVEKALELADAERGKQTERVEIAKVLPPHVRLTSPERALGAKTATLEVRARADSTGVHPVTALHLMIDGRPLPQGRVRIDNPKLGEATATWNILLTAGTQRLSVKADSAVSSALSDEVVVTYQPPDPVETVKLPSLYVLAVGISDYPKDLKLNYAHKDAQVLAETLRTHSKALYEKVEVKELLNAQATQREIRIGLDWLSTRMTQRDVAVLYLAGHGEIAANSNFYFLPADVDPDKISATGVPGNEIKDALTSMPGKVIFMLDACHAGGFESTKKRNARALTDDLIRDLVADERGVIALCASTGRQFALESNEHRHGIFTLAIVEGLKGKATRVEGAIYLHHLDAYVTDRVKELSQGRQSPTTARPANVRSFPLTRP